MRHLTLIPKNTTEQWLYFFIATLLCLGVVHQAMAQTQNLTKEKQFLTVKNNLATAVDSLNKAGVVKAIYAFQPFTNSKNKQLKKLAHYHIGYAYYRLSTIFPDINGDQQEKYLDGAVKHLEKAVNLAPDFAEARALLSGAYGMKAAGGIFSGIKYGPKSGRAIKRALKTAPENPRVHFLNAMGLLMKPGLFGGSTEGAIEEFKKAAELYKTYHPKNKLMPDWGHAEVYAWLGQAYVEAEKYQKAKMAYEQALKVNPGFGWVKYKLLPELKKKME